MTDTKTTETGGTEAQPPGPPAGALGLLNLLSGAVTAQAISTMAMLGIADQLAAGPASVATLATAVDADAPNLYRLLCALTDAGMVNQLDGQRFALTESGQLLRTDVSGSVWGFAVMMGAAFHRDAWTHLYQAVKTGRSAFEDAHGLPLFDYLRRHPSDQAVFDQAMTVSILPYQACTTVFDFGRFPTVVDIGGGRGQILAAILDAYPSLSGILFDLPAVVAEAPAYLAAHGVAHRCRIEAGSFFESVPAGGDAYVLANIVHDWDDDSAVRILRSCRQAMAGDSCVVLIEGIKPSPGSGLTALADLELLVVSQGGRLRDRSDYAALFGAASLELGDVIAAGSAAVITAVPV